MGKVPVAVVVGVFVVGVCSVAMGLLGVCQAWPVLGAASTAIRAARARSGELCCGDLDPGVPFGLMATGPSLGCRDLIFSPFGVLIPD